MTNKVALRLFIVLMMGMSSVFGADMDTILEKFFTFTQSTTSKSIVGLIVLGLAVYIWKNLDRWNEWGWKVGGIVIALFLWLNARTVAGWFF